MVYDSKRGCVRGEDDGRILSPEAYPEIPMPEGVKPPRQEDLTFGELRLMNHDRAVKAFKHHPCLTDWSPAEWSNAMAGEAGETCNLTKKMLRDGPETVDIEDLGDEIADVVIYADLLATRMGLCLEDLVRRKFNKVSEKKGSNLKL